MQVFLFHTFFPSNYIINKPVHNYQSFRICCHGNTQISPSLSVRFVFVFQTKTWFQRHSWIKPNGLCYRSRNYQPLLVNIQLNTNIIFSLFVSYVPTGNIEKKILTMVVNVTGNGSSKDTWNSVHWLGSFHKYFKSWQRWCLAYTKWEYDSLALHETAKKKIKITLSHSSYFPSCYFAVITGNQQ